MSDGTAVGIEQQVTERIIAHLTNRTKDVVETDLRVPIEHFVSPAPAAAEHGLMRRLPLVAAHRSELPKPGDFVTRMILGMSLILVRRNDGSVGAYLNMCRHR